jgi:hypothetical protein
MTRLALAPELALGLSAPAAAAGVMNTAPAYAGSGSNVMCVAQNLDTKQRTVTARILLEDGSVSEAPNTVAVVPAA